MTDYHIYLIFDKVRNRPYYVGKWGGMKNMEYVTGSTYLRRYIQMFGKEQFWSRFEKKRVEQVSFLGDLNEREEYWIREYGTYKIGGNRTKGGSFDWKYRQPKKKPVLQYDLEGNFIKEWEYAKQPVIEGLCVNYDGISCCIRGVQETAGGYIWKEKLTDKFPLKVEKVKRTHSPPRKKVLHYNQDGKLLGEYESPKQCSKELGVPYTLLTQMLKGKRGPRYGETFKYKDTQWRK
jgi:hypothetical protein